MGVQSKIIDPVWRNVNRVGMRNQKPLDVTSRGSWEPHREFSAVVIWRAPVCFWGERASSTIVPLRVLFGDLRRQCELFASPYRTALAIPCEEFCRGQESEATPGLPQSRPRTAIPRERTLSVSYVSPVFGPKPIAPLYLKTHHYYTFD